MTRSSFHGEQQRQSTLVEWTIIFVKRSWIRRLHRQRTRAQRWSFFIGFDAVGPRRHDEKRSPTDWRAYVSWLSVANLKLIVRIVTIWSLQAHLHRSVFHLSQTITSDFRPRYYHETLFTNNGRALCLYVLTSLVFMVLFLTPYATVKLL